MKPRSGVEMCLPAIVLGAACLLSLPTLVLALLWLLIGAVRIGHLDLKSFPTDGVPRRWQAGPRASFLWFYHLAWWPWQMRVELAGLVRTAKARPVEVLAASEVRKSAPRRIRIALGEQP